METRYSAGIRKLRPTFTSIQDQLEMANDVLLRDTNTGGALRNICVRMERRTRGWMELPAPSSLHSWLIGAGYQIIRSTLGRLQDERPRHMTVGVNESKLMLLATV